MKKITTLSYFTLLFCFLKVNNIAAQNCSSPLCGPNLIPNPGFEEYTTQCTTATKFEDAEIYTDASPVKDWSGLSEKMHPITGGCIYAISADYYNSTCSDPVNKTNNCGEGNGSIGILVGEKTPKAGEYNSTLEYVQAKLTEKLKKNSKYCVSFKVKGSASDKTDGIGIWFHNKGQLNINTMNNCKDYIGLGSLINANPQIQNPSGNMIDANCQTISGTFTANGDEEWLVIGNFKKSADTKYITNGSFSIAYYLIVDDVSIKEICETTGLIENLDGLPFEVSSILNRTITVKMNSQLSQQNYQLQVFNAEGKMISSTPVHPLGSKVNIDLSAYSAGLYFISLSENNTILYSKKIILNEF